MSTLRTSVPGSRSADRAHMNELCTRGAGELAAMIRSREVTSAKVREARQQQWGTSATSP